MTGYFSRIARQSGARFRRDDPQRQRRAAGEPSPIDHEETIIVSPADQLDAPPAVDFARPKAPRRSRAIQRPSAEAPLPTVEETRPLATVSAPKQPVHADAGLEATDTRQPPRKLQPDHPVTGPKRADNDPRSAETSLELADTQLPTTDAITVQPSEKRFFEKTTRLIEGPASDSRQVRTIVLSDVQEWIEAGAAVPEDLLDGPPPSIEMPEPREVEVAKEVRPGVVRIVEHRRPEKLFEELTENEPPARINEQNFELSIGSISVVVEGEDKGPTAAAPAIVTAPRQGTRETPRGRSRLSRHYL